MRVAHDMYGETNPAFRSTRSPTSRTLTCQLPVALSGDLAAAFGGTNKNTGLLEWLERSPQVQVGLANRLNS